MQQPPRILSISELSPAYNKDWLKKIDKVFVNGVHIPECVYYNMDKGMARGKRPDGTWDAMQYGTVTVTLIGEDRSGVS